MSLNGSAAELGPLRAYPTADGSFSLHSTQFGEAFHNSAGALNEAQAKFVRPAQLERFQGGTPLAILDVCFGLGYNSAAVWDALPSNAGALQQWWGLELDRRPLDLALEQLGFQQLWCDAVQEATAERKEFAQAGVRDECGCATHAPFVSRQQSPLGANHDVSAGHGHTLTLGSLGPRLD